MTLFFFFFGCNCAHDSIGSSYAQYKLYKFWNCESDQTILTFFCKKNSGITHTGHTPTHPAALVEG